MLDLLRDVQLEPQEWQTKVWGRTRQLFHAPFGSVHELELEAGGYCSAHLHRDRINVFRLIEGDVRVVYLDGLHIRPYELHPGNVCEIPINIGHQLQVFAPEKMIKIYHPKNGKTVRVDDSRRDTVGNSMSADTMFTGHTAFYDHARLPFGIITTTGPPREA